MKEHQIRVTIAPDGTLRAETKGLKGKSCETELVSLLADIAAVNDVTLTAEAKEKDSEVRIDAAARIDRRKS